MLHKALSLLVLVFFYSSAKSSETRIKSYRIAKATAKPRIDGELRDDTWKNVETGGGFKQTFPFDSSDAQSQTSFKL